MKNILLVCSIVLRLYFPVKKQYILDLVILKLELQRSVRFSCLNTHPKKNPW